MHASEHIELLELLARCKVSANEAIARSQAHWTRLDGLLQTFASDAGRISTSDEPIPQMARDALAKFNEELGNLKNTVSIVAQAWQDQLAEDVAALSESANYVTVTLFGRTRAGKSTLMEALTEGDGESIGKGRQHTTRAIKSYPWPPSQPLLRIVDTPGIEGLDGDELGALAEGFVARADHIFFLISDDAVTPDELDRFGQIRTLGKSVTVIFNVKYDDQELLKVAPTLVFDSERLKGHMDWISHYLSERLGIDPPEVIPVHARAAWDATRLPPGPERTHLQAVSRIKDVENRITRFLRTEALGARVRSPRDLLTGYIYTVKEELRPYVGKFRHWRRELEHERTQISRVLRQVNQRGRYTLSNLKIPFQVASGGIVPLVNELIAEGKGGTGLEKRWRELLRRNGVDGALGAFKDGVLEDFRDQMAEEARAHQLDVQLGVGEFEMDDLFGTVDELEKKRRWKLAGRVAARGTGQVAVALAGYAAWNAWNPTGWLAGLFAVGAAIVGAVVDIGVRTATDEWARADQQELDRSRQRIIQNLQDRLWQEYHRVNDHAFEWLNQVTEGTRQQAETVLMAADRACDHLWRLAKRALDDMDVLKEDVDLDLVRQVVAMVVPEAACGAVVVERATRDAGLTKAIIRGAPEYQGSAIGSCIGRGAARLRQVRELLQGDQIALVDSQASPAERITQSLFPARVSVADVRMPEAEGSSVVITLPSVEVGRAIGRAGGNVRLAQQLLGFEMKIQTSGEE